MIQYYTVENTGWSSGISWFKTGGTNANPLRFDDKERAEVYANHCRLIMNDSNTLWRIVYTTIERAENREVVTKEWWLI